MTLNYFDSHGRWVAFRTSETDKNLWSPEAEWIGWLAWGNDDICGVETMSYLGTLVGDRLLKKTNPPSHFTPFTPFTPFPPFTPFTPFTKSAVSMPSGYTDARLG